MLRVPTFGRYAKAHPHPRASKVTYRTLESALTRRCTTDLHFAAYSVPAVPYRLSKESKAAVEMHLAVFDIDHNDAAEAAKIERFIRAHPGAYVYETKNGYRIVLALPESFVLCTEQDAARWSALYLSWLRYLSRRFDIEADPACKDWTRIYRLPRACRDGVVQKLDTLGDPSHIGTWAPRLLPSDLVQVAKDAESEEDPEERTESEGDDHGTGVPLGSRILKAIAYAKEATPAVSGDNGHNVTLAIASDVMRGFDLPRAMAQRVLARHYNPRCEPPWTPRELAHKLDAVEAKGPAWGHLLEVSLDELMAAEEGAPEVATPPKEPSGGSLAERLRKLSARGVRQPMGFESLDGDVMRGGLPAESITFVGGAPGAGKTGFVMHQAFSFAKRGIPVAILACDERADGLAIRVGQMLGCSRDGLENGDEGGAAADRLGDLKIELYDAREGYTIESAAKALHEKHGPGLLVIDSLQTATTKAGAKMSNTEENDKIHKVVRVLSHSIAKYRHCALVTSELNREFYRNNVRAEELNDLAAFKGSGAIEHAADFAIVLRTLEGGEQISAKVAKNRLGYGKPEFFLEWDTKTATMREVARVEVGDEESLDQLMGGEGPGPDRDLGRVAWNIVRENPNVDSRSMLAFAMARQGCKASKAKLKEAIDALFLDARLVKGPEGRFLANPWAGEPDE